MNGVTRAKDCGLPRFFIQQEETQKLNKSRAIGEIKAGVIEGDAYCSGLVCCSIYDTKPIHFLTMASEEIKYITKERDVYDIQNHNRVAMGFHRKNLQEEYNYGMNKIGLGDQLVNYYLMDIWKWKFK